MGVVVHIDIANSASRGGFQWAIHMEGEGRLWISIVSGNLEEGRHTTAYGEDCIAYHWQKKGVTPGKKYLKLHRQRS